MALKQLKAHSPQNHCEKSIAVGISGGVDSAVSAYLLKNAGYSVSGIFMKNWDDDDGSNECTAIQDYEDAQRVCEQIGIELKLINFAHEYFKEVFEHFLSESQKGNTPNPDLFCNRLIKFGHFKQYTKGLGFDFIATGHYARLCDKAPTKHTPYLYRAKDKDKDQSYFLSQVKWDDFKGVRFPLAELNKLEVRQIASQLNLANARKKDSTGICFIGERDFGAFIQRYLKQEEGDIVDESGKRLGTHRGLASYTLGQRKGLNVGGVKGCVESAWFVAKKDSANNQLVIVQDPNHPLLNKTKVTIGQLNWLVDKKLVTSLIQKPLLAQIRHRQKPQKCYFNPIAYDAGDNLECLEVEFESPQRAITPGQALALYDGDWCLGSGIMQA